MQIGWHGPKGLFNTVECLQYEIVESTVPHAYKLVPKAYRQRFRKHKKLSSHLLSLCNSVERILLKEFKDCLPERVVMYLNKQRVVLLLQAAVLADEFLLIHKTCLSQLA